MIDDHDPPPDDLARRFGAIENRVHEAARRVERVPEDVTLVAVSKTHATAVLSEALRAGVVDFGENRVQEAAEKRAGLAAESARARWHLIGNLQSNKARRAVQTFDVIHTLDNVALAERLDRICGEEGRAELPVLVQVDLGGEATKAGVTEEESANVVRAVLDSARLKLTGLMTIPPFLADVERVRPYFRRLRELRDRFAREGAFGDARGELSMGMSHDFEIAIEEGATMVRIGTAIFGARPPAARHTSGI